MEHSGGFRGDAGDQLPEGWERAAPPGGRPSSVRRSGAEGAERRPSEVLTELCWMASLWGLPGTDMSSQLSSFSETGGRGGGGGQGGWGWMGGGGGGGGGGLGKTLNSVAP